MENKVRYCGTDLLATQLINLPRKFISILITHCNILICTPHKDSLYFLVHELSISNALEGECRMGVKKCPDWRIIWTFSYEK